MVVARLTLKSQLSSILLSDPNNCLESVCPSTMNSILGCAANTLATLPNTTVALSVIEKLPLLNNNLSEMSTYTTPFSTLILMSPSLKSPMAPFKFITSAMFIESLRAIDPCKVWI